MTSMTQIARPILGREFSDFFKRKRILVTGASGFVGSHLCDALLALGAEVFGASLDAPAGGICRGSRMLVVDLCNEAEASRMLKETTPDIVYHLAGLVDTRQGVEMVIPTLKNNLLGTLVLMTGLIGTDCQRIVINSSSETPVPGTAPNSPYAASKLAAELYGRMFFELYGLPVVIARPHMVYGPRQPENKLVSYIIRSFLDNSSPMLSSGQRVCDLVYIDDFVRALILMGKVDDAVGRTFDVGSGEGLSIRQIAEKIASMMGFSGDGRLVFGAVPDRQNETPQIADVTTANMFLGWKALWSLEEGLLATVDWIKHQRKAKILNDQIESSGENHP